MGEWTGDVDDDNQSTEGERVARKAVMRLIEEGGSKPETAQAVVHQLFDDVAGLSAGEPKDGAATAPENPQAKLAELLAASSSGDSSNQREEGATAETFDEGRHWHVVFTFNGDTKALDPDEARAYAEDLWKAADEADEKASET